MAKSSRRHRITNRLVAPPSSCCRTCSPWWLLRVPRRPQANSRIPLQALPGTPRRARKSSIWGTNASAATCRRIAVAASTNASILRSMVACETARLGAPWRTMMNRGSAEKPQNVARCELTETLRYDDLSSNSTPFGAVREFFGSSVVEFPAVQRSRKRGRFDFALCMRPIPAAAGTCTERFFPVFLMHFNYSDQ